MVGIDVALPPNVNINKHVEITNNIIDLMINEK